MYRSAHLPVITFDVNEFGNGVLVVDVSGWANRPTQYTGMHVDTVACTALSHTDSQLTLVIDETVLSFLPDYGPGMLAQVSSRSVTRIPEAWR